VLRRRVPPPILLSTLPSSLLWFVDGNAYDLKEFVAKHPGGREALRLAQGTNCTELFRTYHLLRAPTRVLLLKHLVHVDRTDPVFAELLAGSTFTFDDSGFYKTVAARARAHFLELGQGSSP
jgi:cytochrome b involved in lipid metabolism